MARRSLKVGFVHQSDSRDVRNWSGTLYFSREALSRHVGQVVDLSPAPPIPPPYRAARRFLQVATGEEYVLSQEPLIARRYGKYFSRRIEEERPTLVFSPAGSACVSFMDTRVPIIYYSDATWRLLQGYHRTASNTIARTTRGGDELERRTLERSALALFATDWAAESAVRDYGADPAKVHTVFIGANLPNPPAREELPARMSSRRIALLMVGVSWEDKGGAIALETLVHLLERGYDAELTVVGCVPPGGTVHPRMKVIPFLNKQIPAERERFECLWREADFFLLPTRFEAAGVVFCEASAYGIPSITTRTGGVRSLVVDGRNGYTLPWEAGGNRYADLIASLVEDPVRYHQLCVSSRDEFERRLNWDSWGARVAELIEEHVPGLRGFIERPR